MPGKVTMIVNEFENSKAYRLQQIMHTLESVHNVKLDFDSKTIKEIQAIGESCEIVKNSIVKESAFNTALQNPEYTKNMLIFEAVKIYLAEIAPKRMNKKKKAVKESALNEMPSTRSISSGANRAWAHDKKSADRAKNPPSRGFRQPGEMSKNDARDQLDLLTKEFFKKGGKITKEAIDPAKMVKVADFGRKMMEYAQNASSTDEKELRILNTISQVGDKLTQLGTPFGPTTLTDMDKRIIEVARRRMTTQGVSEDVPGQGLKLQPGMVKVKKDNGPEEVINTKDLENKQRQGYQPVAEDDSLNMLYQKYGITEDGVDEAVDQDDDGDNDFADVMIARMTKSGMPNGKAIAMTRNKPYNKESMMEAKKPNLEALKKKKAELEDKMDKISKEGGKMLKTDPLKKQYDKVCADIKAAKKTLKEAAHMETHDDYQADMARSELYRNTKYAMDMMKMIGPDDEVKPWISANLTKAAGILDKVYHYMDYYMTFEQPHEQQPTIAVDEEIDRVEGDTGSIARQNLLMIMEYSTKLFRMIKPGDKIEGWVAMKLTTASEAISCSKHHMDYIQFQKHAGDMMGPDMPVEFEEPIDEVKDEKKVKTNVKETSIANILMSVMLNEEQDLAQAETLLAAKAMSDELQGIAEKLAKMSVDDLMPLVDIMKEQFGQDAANGFNDVVKAALQSVLDSATETKDTVDNAVTTMQQGGTPGVETDISASDLDVPDADEDEEDLDDEFSATPAAAGEPEEPLGRAKKPEAEEAPKELEEGRKSKCAMGEGKDKDVNKAKKKAVIDPKKRTKEEKSKFDPREDLKLKKSATVKEAKKTKPDFLDIDKDGNKKETMKKAAADKKKAEASKKKPVKETKLKEVAPPGKKAEDFIKKNKASFKERYGKRWQEVLYATAWKKFGPKKESYVKATKMLETATEKKKQLMKAFESHKAKFSQMVIEGQAVDPLNSGYGLEGQNILDQLSETNSMISKLKAMIQSEIQAGIKDLIISEQRRNLAKKLSESKARAPYGILWRDATGKKSQKFFETDDLRKYWIDLNKDSLNEHKLINPSDFDNRIQSLIVKKG